MKYIIILLAALSFVASCEKDPPAPPPPDPDPEPIDTIINHVGCDPSAFTPIYGIIDSLFGGVGYANKCDKKWTAETGCRINDEISGPSKTVGVSFLTYTPIGEQREHLAFSCVSLIRQGLTYKLTSVIEKDETNDIVFCTYDTWRSDGDVIEDWYVLDTTVANNHLTIKKLDLANRRIEGSFYAAFNIKEPRFNPKNPKRVVFSNGTFWGVIHD